MTLQEMAEAQKKLIAERNSYAEIIERIGNETHQIEIELHTVDGDETSYVLPNDLTCVGVFKHKYVQELRERMVKLTELITDMDNRPSDYVVGFKVVETVALRQNADVSIETGKVIHETTPKPEHIYMVIDGDNELNYMRSFAGSYGFKVADGITYPKHKRLFIVNETLHGDADGGNDTYNRRVVLRAVFERAMKDNVPCAK